MSSPVVAGPWPPGHHAGRDYTDGYRFLNNAAVATHYMRDQGARRIGILDIENHHGNGTEDIFHRRSGVFTVSVHADPVQELPCYIDFADETGAEGGKEHNLNQPLP